MRPSARARARPGLAIKAAADATEWPQGRLILSDLRGRYRKRSIYLMYHKLLHMGRQASSEDSSFLNHPG